MSFDYEDWARLAAMNAAPTPKRSAIPPQAAVQAENLTGHPAWDVFLSYLQAFVETTEQQHKSCLAMVAGPDVVSYDDIVRYKLAAAECAGSLKAARAIMSLPKDIIASAEGAQSIAERIAEAG